MEVIYIFLLALLIDVSLGDPPDKWHPVAWLGKLIYFEMKLAPGKSHKSQFLTGMLLVLLTVTTAGVVVFLLLRLLASINIILYVIFAAVLFKFTFSIHGLVKATHKIRTLIQQDELSAARENLRSLVSRNTASLDRSQVISATIESVAENICDSFVAPVFYYLILGIPGAVIYRIVNTYDAMIGYHGDWEYFGKFAARLDDVLNFIPARLSAFLLIVAAWVCRKNTAKSCAIMWRDHARTESPNAGWTMSAIAGALEVKLEKADCYQLGQGNHTISINDLDSTVQIALIAAIIWSFITIAIQGVIIAAG